MDAVSAAIVSKQKFLAIIRQVRTEQFEKGAVSEEQILEGAIANDEKLWKAVQPVFAKEAALGLVRRIVKATPLVFDGPQQKLFDDLPQRIAIPGGGWKPLNKANLKDLRWHTNWYEQRLLGNVRRSTRDTATLERLRHLSRVVERCAGKDDSVTIAEALRERDRRGIR